jgi:hypothetical protein
MLCNTSYTRATNVLAKSFRSLVLETTKGRTFSPRGEICPLGLKLSPLFTTRGEHSLLFKNWRGEGITSSLGDKFTPGGQLRPWGTTSPLGSKFAPRGEVKNGPQGCRPSVRLVILLYIRECSHLGWTIPLGDKVNPWGPSSPLGENFPSGAQRILLKTGLYISLKFVLGESVLRFLLTPIHTFIHMHIRMYIFIWS